MIIVSRRTVSNGRSKACSRCGFPRDVEGQRYCRRCHSEYMREWRAGKVETLLTPEEREVVLALRALALPIEDLLAGSAGRHRAVSP